MVDTSFGHQLNRQIVIPVEIPSISIVHSAQLRIITENSDGNSGDALAAVGQIIPAALTIRHTRRWDTAKTREAPPHTAEKPLEFSYEVQANTDTWLIAGRRKGHFCAKVCQGNTDLTMSNGLSQENEIHTFSLMLLPQRPGYLLYPTVEIRTLANGSSTSDPRSSVAEQGFNVSRDGPSDHVSSMTCETDYRNQADAILVLPNLKSTTVSLDPGGPGGNAWLIDSERRVEATVS